MCRRNLLLVTCVAMAWSGLAAAQTMTPVRQPATSASPSTPTPANQTAVNPAANPANVTARARVRVAAAPVTQRDCSQLRGIEKSECERRDTVRDDLPAGVTTGAAARRQ
jgi:hypothetical protein